MVKVKSTTETGSIDFIEMKSKDEQVKKISLTKITDPNEIFKAIGEFGRYQKLLFLLVGLTASVPGWLTYSYVFNGATPDFRCKLPNYENDTFEIQSDYHQELISQYIPDSKTSLNKYETCKFNVYNFFSRDEEEMHKNFTLEECNEYVYSKKFFKETAVTKWNLVCSNQSRKSLYLTLNFVGSVFSFLLGALSDKFGRKKTLHALLFVNFVVALLYVLVLKTLDKSPEAQQGLFGLLRLILGLTCNFYTIAMVLVIELVGPRYRATAGSCMYYFFVFGELINTFISFLERDFTNYFIWSSVVLFVFFLLVLLVPESPRYLIIKDKRALANKVFTQIAKYNNRSHFIEHETENAEEKLKLSPLKPQQVQLRAGFFKGFKVLFKSKQVLVQSAIILMNWVVNSMVYYGISLNTSALAGDPYMNAVYMSLVEMTAIVTCHFVIGKFGRKKPYTLSMLLAGVSLLLIQFIPSDAPIYVTILALISKFAISFTYNAIYIVTAESFPTSVRSTLLAFCSSSAKIASAVAPYIQLLGNLYWYSLPYVIFGAFSLAAAVTYWVFLPETKENQLSDHVEEEAEEADCEEAIYI